MLDPQEPIAKHLSSVSGFVAHSRTSEIVVDSAYVEDMAAFVSAVKQQLSKEAK